MDKEKDKERVNESESETFNIQEQELLTMQKVRKQLHKLFLLYGSKRPYDKRSIVFKSNDPAGEAYYVETGGVRVYNLTPEGKEVTFEIFNPGESLGLVEVIANSSRIRYAETICRKNTLLVMNKSQLLDLIFGNKEFSYLVMWSLTHYVLRYQRSVEHLAILSVQERVIQLLIRMSKERGKEIGNCTVIDIPITHENIAKMVGSSRPTVTLILNELRDQGVINWEQKKIKILRSQDLVIKNH